MTKFAGSAPYAILASRAAATPVLADSMPFNSSDVGKTGMFGLFGAGITGLALARRRRPAARMALAAA